MNGDKRSKWKKPAMYATLVVIAGVVSTIIYATAQHFTRDLTANPSVKQAIGNPASATLGTEGTLLRKTSEGFRQVAKKVGPAVVNIKASKGGKAEGRGGMRGAMPRRRGGPGIPQQDEDQFPRDPFSDFFERFGSPFPQMETPQMSMGSGILIDKEGHIVTNNHVVEGASDIIVNFTSQKTDFKAKLVGTDPKTDLAVLKLLKIKDLPAPAEFADTASVEVGDWAIAIGSPFALGQSVTVGIVSAKGGRNSLALAGAEFGGDLIQTDAAINPGNSGGPLCDLEGKVMGVNTAIYTRSGGYMGIGFAIPSNLVKDITTRLIQHGKIVRGWLGVFIQPLSEQLAANLGVKAGVSIHEVIEESPAAVAGIKAGDAVIEVNGKPVVEVNELQRIISEVKPGQTVKLKVVSERNRTPRTISVKIGELPDETVSPKSLGQGEEEADKLGVVVAPQAGGKGVVVQGVQPGSLAHQIGLQAGDVIASVNGAPVDSVAQYKKATKGKELRLVVKRNGREKYYELVIPD